MINPCQWLVTLDYEALLMILSPVNDQPWLLTIISSPLLINDQPSIWYNAQAVSLTIAYDDGHSCINPCLMIINHYQFTPSLNIIKSIINSG